MRHLTLPQLSASLDDALSGVSLELVRRHFLVCEECRARAMKIQRTDGILSQLITHDPGEFWFDAAASEIAEWIEGEQSGDFSGPKYPAGPPPWQTLPRGTEPSDLHLAARDLSAIPGFSAEEYETRRSPVERDPAITTPVLPGSAADEPAPPAKSPAPAEPDAPVPPPVRATGPTAGPPAPPMDAHVPPRVASPEVTPANRREPAPTSRAPREPSPPEDPIPPVRADRAPQGATASPAPAPAVQARAAEIPAPTLPTPAAAPPPPAAEAAAVTSPSVPWLNPERVPGATSAASPIPMPVPTPRRAPIAAGAPPVPPPRWDAHAAKLARARRAGSDKPREAVMPLISGLIGGTIAGALIVVLVFVPRGRTRPTAGETAALGGGTATGMTAATHDADPRWTGPEPSGSETRPPGTRDGQVAEPPPDESANTREALEEPGVPPPSAETTRSASLNIAPHVRVEPTAPARPARTTPAVTPETPSPPSTPSTRVAGTVAETRPATPPPTESDAPRPQAESGAATAAGAPTRTTTTTAPARSPGVDRAPKPGEGERTEGRDDEEWPLLCGIVQDDTGAPIAGARVLLADLDLGARTDRRGRFCISAPAGSRTLSVMALGFTTQRRLVTVANGAAELKLVLKGAP